MPYNVDILPKAQKEINEYLKRGNKTAFRKIQKFIVELQQHPTTGTGKPEQLRYGLSGYWSRRIDKKNRLIYRIEEEKITVIVASAMGHY